MPDVAEVLWDYSALIDSELEPLQKAIDSVQPIRLSLELSIPENDVYTISANLKAVATAFEIANVVTRYRYEADQFISFNEDKVSWPSQLNHKLYENTVHSFLQYAPAPQGAASLVFYEGHLGTFHGHMGNAMKELGKAFGSKSAVAMACFATLLGVNVLGFAQTAVKVIEGHRAECNIEVTGAGYPYEAEGWLSSEAVSLGTALRKNCSVIIRFIGSDGSAIELTINPTAG